MASGVGGGEGGGRAGGGGGGGACCWVAHDVDDVYLHIWTGVPGVLAQLKNHPLGKKVEGGGRRQPGGRRRDRGEEDVGVVGVVGWPHAKKFFSFLCFSSYSFAVVFETFQRLEFVW